MLQRQDVPRKLSRAVLERRHAGDLLIGVVEEVGLLVVPDRQGGGAEEQRGEGGEELHICFALVWFGFV